MRILLIITITILFGCSTPPQQASYDVSKYVRLADANGWYHFSGFDFRGGLIEDKPNGSGECIKTGTGYKESVSYCQFDHGVRIDKQFVQEVNYENNKRDELFQSSTAKYNDWVEQRNAKAAEERREEQRESAKANRELLANFQKGLNNISAESAATTRQTLQLYGQAQQNQRDRDSARQKEADDARAAQNERIRLQNQRIAQQDQDRANQYDQTRRQGEQDRQREQDLQRERDRQQEQARQKERAQQQEQVRQQEQARKKAEAEAAKLAEERALQQSKSQYLRAVAAGSRFQATYCTGGEGKYYALGNRPRISPEVVGCVDVTLRVYCAGSGQSTTMVAHNFIGGGGCFSGDPYEIDPKPNCKLEEVRIEVVEARSCY
jgi:hypothetical protein